ncbi:hypothetical protein BS47DRAFT_1052417 [Hydnum rufescens UP504]|uniref:Uncharacterized protein n=1 Tax=Hydnum rufescens UP504 TaxID=1448309 RepID=A0A9P6DVB7_9AGAM|nr:hypothetical protein BS47DRAFT_1052417 [Hydnum rufescens UP504]
MRKTPYMISLVGVFFSLTLTLISLALPYWLRVQSPIDSPSTTSIDYGLYRRCESRVVQAPPVSPSPPNFFPGEVVLALCPLGFCGYAIAEAVCLEDRGLSSLLSMLRFKSRLCRWLLPCAIHSHRFSLKQHISVWRSGSMWYHGFWIFC